MKVLGTMLTILLGIILSILILFASSVLLGWLRENGKIDDNTYSRLICNVE